MVRAARGMIAVFGSINMDLVARVKTIARPGETVLSRRAESSFGGKGANQAVAAARMAGRGVTQVAMVAAVGRDPFGQACCDNLSDNGIDISSVRVTNEPTGCAFITVDDRGENAITVASGANMALKGDDLPEDLLSRAAVLVLQMEVPIGESLEAARRARKGGVLVVWNFAPVPHVANTAEMEELLSWTDVLVVNEHEATAVAQLLGKDIGDDYLKAGSGIARAHGLVCIVTAGERGAVAIHPDGTQTHVGTQPITPVDTTGAGDTFVGVLASGIAEGFSIDAAMQRACLAAAQACLASGAQAGMPYREALDELMHQG